MTEWSIVKSGMQIPESGVKLKKKNKFEKGSFERLKKEKQEKIMHALIDEFANAGYDMASTNTVAKVAGISKGSLFKYFGTKEHMFYHIADHVLAHYAESVKAVLPLLPGDLLERLRAFQEKTIDLLGSNPAMYRFMMIAMKNSGEDLRRKWEPVTKDIFERLVAGTDHSYLRIGVKDLIMLVRWFDFAIDAEMLELAEKVKDAGELKKLYKKRFDLIYDVLENGIYK